MRLLFDCDVLLDVALKREPHFSAGAAVLDWAEKPYVPGKFFSAGSR